MSPRDRSTGSAWVASVVLVAVLAAGCGAPKPQDAIPHYRVDAPSLHGVRIDRKASEVRWTRETDSVGRKMKDIKAIPTDVTVMRDQVAAGLDRSFGGEPDGRLARFRLTWLEQSLNNIWWVAPCLIVLSLVGCPTTRRTITLELELELDGHRYKARGHGAAFALVTLDYSNEMGKALDDALRQIDRQVQGLK